MARRRATRRLLPAGLGGALALAALLCPAASRAQAAAERLLDSAAGLEKTLAALKLSEEERPLTDALRDVGEQARAGRVRLALYRLQSPWALVAARAYVGARSDVKEVEALEAEWKRLGAEMDERERRLA
jgi:hypothetical protein